MGREGRDYWVAQLAEYWESGLTVQEYSELKELPYESARRWIRVLQSKRPVSYMSASKSSRVPGELEKLCGKRRPIGRQQGFGLICRSRGKAWKRVFQPFAETDVVRFAGGGEGI